MTIVAARQEPRLAKPDREVGADGAEQGAAASLAIAVGGCANDVGVFPRAPDWMDANATAMLSLGECRVRLACLPPECWFG